MRTRYEQWSYCWPNFRKIAGDNCAWCERRQIRDAENHSIIVYPAVHGSAIKTPVRPLYNSRFGPGTIRLARERIQHSNQLSYVPSAISIT